ncbi:MAG: alpha/beta fold hydrolase [Pseudomonadota bacterium]
MWQSRTKRKLKSIGLGEPNGVPLLVAHGLFGSARNWRAIARALARDRPVVTVDMRNHGASFHDPAHDYPAMAADLGASIAAHGGKADLLGHSMGGKAAMALALSMPASVRRLVVADIAPVGYSHSHAGHIAAMRAVDLAAVTTRAEADAQLTAAGVDEAPVRAFLLQSLLLHETPPRWALNLDALDAAMDDLVGWPGMPGRFDGPALFLAGGQSDYLLPAHHAAIRGQFPAAQFATIEGAGHWLHAEKPREVIAAVARFLAA